MDVVQLKVLQRSIGGIEQACFILGGRISYDFCILDRVIVAVEGRRASMHRVFKDNWRDCLVIQIDIRLKAYSPTIAVIVIYTCTARIVVKFVSITDGEECSPFSEQSGEVQEAFLVLYNNLGVFTIRDDGQTVNEFTKYIVSDSYIRSISNLDIICISTFVVVDIVIFNKNCSIACTCHSNKTIANAVCCVSCDGYITSISTTSEEHSMLICILDYITCKGYVLCSTKFAKSCNTFYFIIDKADVLRTICSIQINKIKLIVISNQLTILNSKTIDCCVGCCNHNRSIVSSCSCCKSISKLNTINHKVVHCNSIIAIAWQRTCLKYKSIDLSTFCTDDGNVFNASAVVISPCIGNFIQRSVAMTRISSELQCTIVYARLKLDFIARYSIVKSSLSSFSIGSISNLSICPRIIKRHIVVCC